MISLSCAVMAHPKRAEMVEDLLSRLDRPVKVVWDERNDRYDTGARAMEAFDRKCSHHLVIQDDAVPCRDLLAGVEAALKTTPGNVPVSLYTGRVRPFGREINRLVSASNAAGASWIKMRGIYWGPAIVVPTSTIRPMLTWFRGAGTKVTNYDRRVSYWYAMRRKSCWYTRPSLVEHRGTKSLVGHPGSIRTAYDFLGEDASALDVDWTGPVLDIPHSARMDEARQAEAAVARHEKQLAASK